MIQNTNKTDTDELDHLQAEVVQQDNITVKSGTLIKRGKRSNQKKRRHYVLTKGGKILERKDKKNSGKLEDKSHQKQKEFCQLTESIEIEFLSAGCCGAGSKKGSKTMKIKGLRNAKRDTLEALTLEDALEWQQCMDEVITNLQKSKVSKSEVNIANGDYNEGIKRQSSSSTDVIRSSISKANDKKDLEQLQHLSKHPPKNEQGYPSPLQLVEPEREGETEGNGWYLEADGQMSLYACMDGSWMAVDKRPYDQAVIKSWMQGGVAPPFEEIASPVVKVSSKMKQAHRGQSSNCQVLKDPESSSFIPMANGTRAVIVLDNLVFEDDAEEEPLKLHRRKNNSRIAIFHKDSSHVQRVL